MTEAHHGGRTVLPLHAHPRACVILVLGGAFEEICEDGRRWCCPGDVLLRPADAAHIDRYADQGSLYAVVEIPDHVLAAIDNTSSLLSGIHLFRGDRPRSLAQEIRRVARRPRRGSVAQIEKLLVELLGTVLSSHKRTTDPARATAVPPWMRQLYDRIHDEFRSRPSLRELAADAGVHPDHVCRAFRRHFGFTISDLVRHRRVVHAAKMIRTTDRPLSAVAYDAGFSDQSHMTRQMKRHLGAAPNELRDAVGADARRCQDRSIQLSGSA